MTTINAAEAYFGGGNKQDTRTKIDHAKAESVFFNTLDKDKSKDISNESEFNGVMKFLSDRTKIFTKDAEEFFHSLIQKYLDKKHAEQEKYYSYEGVKATYPNIKYVKKHNLYKQMVLHCNNIREHVDEGISNTAVQAVSYLQNLIRNYQITYHTTDQLAFVEGTMY